MFVNFGFEDIAIEECIIEIKIGNKIQKQKIRAIPDIIQMQFEQLLQQAANAKQPIKIKLIKEEIIWNQLERQSKTLENYIQFANKMYMEAFPEEFKEE